MASTPQDGQFQTRIQRLESLLGEIDTFPDPLARAKTREIVETLLEFQGTALAIMLEQIRAAGASGESIVNALATDDLVGSLLVLHGLHPLGLAERVEQALERTRPLLKSHGGNVELLGIASDGSVELRLNGSCHGCPSSQATLKFAIEEAVYAAAPEVAAIRVEGVAEAQQPPPAAGFVPLSQLGAAPDRVTR